MAKVYVCKIAWSSNRWKGLSGYKQEVYENDIKNATFDYFNNEKEFCGYTGDHFNFADSKEFNSENIDKGRYFGFVQHPANTHATPLPIGENNILMFISNNAVPNNRGSNLVNNMKLIGFYLDAKSEEQNKECKKIKVNIPKNLILRFYNKEKKQFKKVENSKDETSVNCSGSIENSFLLDNPIILQRQRDWGFNLGNVNFTDKPDVNKLKNKLNEQVERQDISDNDRSNIRRVLKMLNSNAVSGNNLGEDEEVKKEIELLKTYKQIILYGPPGTGKTYSAQKLSKKILNSENIDSDPRFRLVVFHPSFEYEQFMRGLKPFANGNNIEFKTVEGHFLQMCWQALYQSWQDLKNGACKEHSSDSVDAKIILEHTKCVLTNKNSEKICVLVIDEINRGNVPALLGELVYAIEGDKRGKPVSLPYQMPKFEHFKETFSAEEDNNIEEFYNTVKDWGSKIYIPHNLFIIGTMNTSDKSIGTIDAAIRRRFPLVYIGPDKGEVKIEELKEPFEELNGLFKQENDNEIRIGGIGHSYFMKKTEIEHQIKYFVIPLIREYVELGVAGEKTENLRKIIVHYNDNNNAKTEKEKFIKAVNSSKEESKKTSESESGE